MNTKINKMILLFTGILGFVLISLGVVLLVIRYPLVHITIGLIIFGIMFMIYFCHPQNSNYTIVIYLTILITILYLIMSGFIGSLYTSGWTQVIAVTCVGLGVLLQTIIQLYLVLIFTSHKETEEKVKECFRELRENLMKKE